MIRIARQKGLGHLGQRPPRGPFMAFLRYRNAEAGGQSIAQGLVGNKAASAGKSKAFWCFLRVFETFLNVF